MFLHCVYTCGLVYTHLSIRVFAYTSDRFSLCGAPFSNAVVSVSQPVFASLQVYCLSDEDEAKNFGKVRSTL